MRCGRKRPMKTVAPHRCKPLWWTDEIELAWVNKRKRATLWLKKKLDCTIRGYERRRRANVYLNQVSAAMLSDVCMGSVS